MQHLTVAFILLAMLPLTARAAETAISREGQGMSGSEKLVPATANLTFGDWIAGFRARAEAQGIRADVMDRAFAGIEYNTSVIEKDRNQSEFTRTIWDYLDSAVSADRVANGRAALAAHGELLERIEEAYGVDKEVVVAIWGLESAYGTFRGNIPIIPAMATLAFDGRRGAFFEGQLVAALKILQAGDVDPSHMTGSWAGAMGHTQFMPTSFLEHAVDFTGDGKRDIWSDDPADALASTAAYLRHFGWQKDEPWGVEVRVPEGFDYGLTGERVKKSAVDWAALGIRAMDGQTVPDHGEASILMPAGARGAAFMIFRNFHVIERYNAADAYVIAVGHLADRIAGGPPIRADWPREDRALLAAERQELQEKLTEAGFSTGGVDGKIGPNTIAAIREFQRTVGLVPDGYASLEVLGRLR
jgi:membrane-bound lytic murein transglycosylase B